MSAIRTIAGGLDRVSVRLFQVGLVTAVLAVVVMMVSASWQVFARYLLDQPPIWTEELARFSMVWAGMMGASCAYRLKADPTLFPEALKLRGPANVAATLVRSLGALIFVSVTIWCCIFGPGGDPARGYIARLLGRQAETMPVPMMVFGIAIPIAFAFVVIHILADIARLALPAETPPEGTPEPDPAA